MKIHHVLAEHLYKLWKEMLEKFESLNLANNKVLHSGSEVDEVSVEDSKFYNSMAFCERHVSARPIKSSMSSMANGHHATPPVENFARRKKAKIDELDSQLAKTNELINLTLEKNE